MEQEVPKEKWFDSEQPDPVFEGMVKEFSDFDEALQSISSQIEAFLAGADELADGLQVLSDSVAADLERTEDRRVATDCYRLRQAAQQIAREDAPHSSMAKLKRNMDFNIVKPLESHLANNEKLKTEVEKRRRRLEEFRSAGKQLDECTRRELSETDPRFVMAQQEYETSKKHFDEVDGHVFEWLYILEAHRNDILDSCLQTLKHLQYEFFATSAHALSGALPARMAFRPLVEMSPDCLETQVELEIRDVQEDMEAEGSAGFSMKLAERLARDGKARAGQSVDEAECSPPLPVDPLSLSSLLSQGFEEGPARRALRLHRNETQAALDWLIEGGGDEASRAPRGDGVRESTTARLLQKRQELLQQQRERLRLRSTDGAAPAATLGASALL